MEATLASQFVREYWDRQPCNVKHSPSPIGSKKWSDEVTRRKYFVEPHIPKFAEFEKWNFKRVLEIGCGIGTDTLEFARNGAVIDAVDISQKSIDLVRKRVNLYNNIAQPALLCDNAENGLTYLPVNAYDLVYSFGVIHHTEHPEKVVKCAHDHLKPGGEFRLMLYSKYSIKNLTMQQPEAQAGCPIVKTYTADSARKLLKDFRIDSIQKTHIFPWNIEAYKNYTYTVEWYYKWMSTWLFKWLEGRLGWHLLIKATKI